MHTCHMSNQQIASRIAYAARSTQRARQSYWAAVAEGNDRRAALAARGLAVAERGLIAATGSPTKARAAEIAHIESLHSH